METADFRTARMPWEKPYLEALIDALRPSGNVLEVGFGLGYSSAHIQTYHPQHLTIIESNPDVAKEAKKWAENFPNVTVIQDQWKSALPALGYFDAIFFNDCSVESQMKTMEYQETAHVVVSKGAEVLRMVEEQLPQLKSICYSDSDIDEFYEQVGKFHSKEMSRFLCELRNNQQISGEQYEKVVQKYRLERQSFLEPKKYTDPVIGFLKTCLGSHMSKGSRFSCFSANPISKFEDPQFFEQIITNADLDYQERLMPVTVPAECEYYKHPEALIIVIEKMV